MPDQLLVAPTAVCCAEDRLRAAARAAAQAFAGSRISTVFFDSPQAAAALTGILVFVCYGA